MTRIMTIENEVERFWRSYTSRLGPGGSSARLYDSWHFGDTEALANELSELVRTGRKTSTSSLVWTHEEKGWKMPVVGDHVVVTTWDGKPSCIIEITEVAIRPFGEIDERFAHDYGEGDRTLRWWREAMWEYYAEECRKLGRKQSPDMPLVCQRFRVVHKS
jgi:uncharacterized protein YhfF